MVFLLTQKKHFFTKKNNSFVIKMQNKALNFFHTQILIPQWQDISATPIPYEEPAVYTAILKLP